MPTGAGSANCLSQPRLEATTIEARPVETSWLLRGKGTPLEAGVRALWQRRCLYSIALPKGAARSVAYGETVPLTIRSNRGTEIRKRVSGKKGRMGQPGTAAARGKAGKGTE